ncbi:PEP-CTERM sorting domain-containing protein [Nitrospira sp. M1]
MYLSRVGILTFLSLLMLTAAHVGAVSIAPTDLDPLTLGARIVGPVGPTVDTSLVNAAGESVGDLQGSVSCPTGFAACVPPVNPAGTIYTYVHEVTPGVDFPNDPPFPQPAVVVPFEDVMEFSLGFPAEGFNGEAGFSFSDTETALETGGEFSVELLSDNSLQWTANGVGWGTGETIAFFWQTTQPPSGPGGVYVASNGITSGIGAGPLPTPAPAPIPEPATFGLMLLGSVALLIGRRVLRRE